MRDKTFHILILTLCIGSFACGGVTSRVDDSLLTPDMDGVWSGTLSSTEVSSLETCDGVAYSTPERRFTLIIHQAGLQLRGTISEEIGGWGCRISGIFQHGGFGAGSRTPVLSFSAANCGGGCDEVSCAVGGRQSLCLAGFSFTQAMGNQERPMFLRSTATLDLVGRDLGTGATTFGASPEAQIVFSR